MSQVPDKQTFPLSSELWSPDLIRHYDLAGPRYTSYPTAAQFSEKVGGVDWQRAVETSNANNVPLSLYIHIPFCDTVCYYCACNKIITANKKVAAPYIQHLQKELAIQAEHITPKRPVNQLHWGGGTPTYISHEQMQEVMQTLRQYFCLHDDDSGEYSIEIHPAGVNPKRVQQLRSLGFNRLSMGIQDFDPVVQRAVNRFNSLAEVERLMKEIRAQNFHSVSMDLIYGLPKQNIENFSVTLDHVIDLSPDRLSIFNYAHMPHLFKTQKQINHKELPEPQEKLEILHCSIEKLLQAGYVYIGMDHFAKPNDELSKAQQQGKLQRNFQGYATHADCDLLALGLSSISSIGDLLIQNCKNMDEYTTRLNRDELPFLHGVKLNRDDKIRRQVINQLMCQFKVEFDSIENEFNITFMEYFAEEYAELKTMEQDGLLELHKKSIVVRPAGRLLIRRIAMVFDAYLREKRISEQVRFSRII